MILKYLSNTTFNSLSTNYPYDSDINFQNYKIYAEGRLSLNVTPVFSNLSDFSRNNYSLLYLTNQVKMSEFTDFYSPQGNQSIIVGKIATKDNNHFKYLKFDASIDDQEFYTVNYDQSFDQQGLNEPLNTFVFIKKSETVCNIKYEYAENEYYLNFNPTTLNINFTILSAFDTLKNYTRNFNYVYTNMGILTLQCRINGTGYRVLYSPETNRLVLSAVNQIEFTDPRCLLYLTAGPDIFKPEITIDWASYEKTFNQNNISVDFTKSFFDTKTNFLIHCEYLKTNAENVSYNLLPLKTQLNIKNKSSRSNIFIGEDEILNRDYCSIFSGNRQEKGHSNIMLQYSSYTFPYEFKAGKTTWFHMPQSMWPFERININDTKLVEAGAIGGNHPLKADKVFKKLGNYKDTSNIGNATNEHTGQWLCSWLSAAPDITVKPVWVDRYYNPLSLTPFQALTASPGSILYKPSYSSYLKDGIYDVPSSLTFEPGNLYALSHIGKNDALKNISSFTPFLNTKNFTIYTNNKSLLTPKKEKNIITYNFSNNESAVLIPSILKENVFTISFWAARNDWSTPCGYQLGGNFTDYGIGIFNYQFVNPLLMYILSDNTIVALNSDLEIINKYNLGTNEQITHFCRRDPLNSFHIFTNNSTGYELNLQEAVLDTIKINEIPTQLNNNNNNGYILGRNRLDKINLLTNNISVGSGIYINTLDENAQKYNNGRFASFNKIVTTPEDTVFVLPTLRNTLPRLINNSIYFLGHTSIISGKLYKIDLSIFDSVSAKNDIYNNKNILCNKIQATANSNSTYSTFNIDKSNNFWCASGLNIDILDSYGIPYKTVTVATKLSSYNFNHNTAVIQNIAFAEGFLNNNLEQSVYVSCSGNKEIIIFKLNQQGNIIRQVSIPTHTYTNIDPTNYDYNLTQTDYATVNNYAFKARLFNKLNTEDSIILNLDIVSNDLSPGYHHFAITVDCLNGISQLYLDNEHYKTQFFDKGTYIFSSLFSDNIVIGATPFYNGTLLSEFLSKNNTKYYYTADLSVQNFYLFNTILDYFDIGMLYKEKIGPDDLEWHVPAGRRYYIDTISRYFDNQVPGFKSNLLNLTVRSNLLSDECKAALEPIIIKTVLNNLPNYTKLNKLSWVSMLEQKVNQPNFGGNTVTNAEISR